MQFYDLVEYPSLCTNRSKIRRGNTPKQKTATRALQTEIQLNLSYIITDRKDQN